MDSSVIKPLLEEIAKHKKAAEEYRQLAREAEQLALKAERTASAWESILSQAKALQEQEQQPSGDKVIQMSKTPASVRSRFDYAREVIQQHRTQGVFPSDIRRLATEQGFNCPSSFPYSMLHRMIKNGKLRRDDFTGRYFPIDGLFTAKVVEGEIVTEG